MKRIMPATLILFVLFIASASTTPAQSGKAQSALARSSEIQVSKDNVETSVSTMLRRIHVSLKGREVPDISLYLAITASFPPSGTITKPDYVQLSLWNKSEPDLTFGVRSDRLLWFEVDGDRIVLGHMQREDLRDIGGVSGFIETLQVNVPYDDFLKIANGKQVTGRLGSLTFELTEDQRNVFQEFIKTVSSK